MSSFVTPAFWLCCLWLFVLSLITSPGSITSQLVPYQSSPLRLYSFDVYRNVSADNARSKCTWQPGRYPHTGRMAFNGEDEFLDFFEYRDDRNLVWPSVLPNSITIEAWAQWTVLNSWSRLLDCGAQAAVDNIIIANEGTTNNLVTSFFRNTDVRDIVFPRTIFPNTWQHIVLTLEQKALNDSTSAQAGIISIYLDGVLISKNENAYLLRSVERRNCFLGKSNWGTADGYFGGVVDDFFIYDHALSGETVAAHHVLSRPPIFELDFANDPRKITGYNASQYTYSWSLLAAGDNSTTAKYHQGHLDLSQNSFVDLYGSRRYWQSWVGSEPLPEIGGWDASGASNTLPHGWTIEILFKSKLQERFAKVFDLGRGLQDENIQLGYSSDTSRFVLVVYSSYHNNYTTVQVLPALQENRWYHMAIVFAPFERNDYSGMVHVYVDGKLVVSAWCNQPVRVVRDYSFLGRSTWSEDEYMDMLLDNFRIYDYAVDASEIQALYDLTHEPIPVDLTNSSTVWQYNSAPSAAYTFTNVTQIMAQQGVEGTNFRYMQGAYPRLGLAVFDGSTRNSYVNLQYYPHNAAGDVLPRIGGSVSFEVWARWNSLRRWSRIFDLGARMTFDSDNILLANRGDTNDLVFDVYGGEYHNTAVATNAIEIGRWHHIVASVEQVSLVDVLSAESGLISLYVDGVLRDQLLGYLPRPISRPNSFLGRSNWALDQYFDGQIDAFLYYDTALSYEEVQAHYLLPKAPVFELSFHTDPRPFINYNLRSQFTYSWEKYDPADRGTDDEKFHDGHIVLDGDQYVNLTTATGLSSIGTVLPSVLLGPSAAANWGNANFAYNGWSFEISFKILRFETGAKIFDFSNGKEEDEFGIGYDWDLNRLVWFCYNPLVLPGRNFVILEAPQDNKWYHVVVTMRRQGNQGGGNLGSYTAYVDGSETATTTSFPIPRAVVRTQAYLSKSPWVEDYIDMRLDTFRIMDFVLTLDQVLGLYSRTIGSLAGIPRPMYTTGPLLEYTFDQQPLPEEFNGGTSFEWRQGTDGHLGIAHFDGVNNFVNLLAFADDSGTAFPQIFGNKSFSFEFWVQYEAFNWWSRLIDIGNEAERDNILIANREQSSQLAFHTYMNISNSYLDFASPVTLGTWHHIVATLDDLTTTDFSINPLSMQAARKTVYVDGRPIMSNLGYRPLALVRQFAYVGKSHWSADALFKGSIDSMYMYDYALSTEQIAVHYIMPRPAIFDLSFTTDPRPRLSITPSFYTYSWASFDPTDAFSSDAQYHTGHLVLSPGLAQFVNLSTATGWNSVGVLLPRIGGRTTGVGDQTDGWSFEFIVKLSTIANYAKLIDFGNGAYNENIVLGYEGTSGRLRFQVFNRLKSGSSEAYAAMTVIENVQLDKWYHIFIVLSEPRYATFDCKWDAYVDGFLVNTLPQGWLPQPLLRTSSLIGKSNWGDDAFAGKIDAIRIYDYKVSERQVYGSYRLVHDPNPVRSTSSSTGAVRSSSSTAVRLSSSSSSSSVRSSSSTGRSFVCFYPYIRLGNSCVCDLSTDEECLNYCCDANSEPDCDTHYLVCTDSTGAAAPAVNGGLTSTAVIGIVFAVIVGAGAALYLYFTYCRSSNNLSKPDSQQSLMADTRMGTERVMSNGYSTWQPPSATSATATSATR